MQKRVYIIHGWEGTPEGGWKPWLASELEARGFEVFIPAMPNTTHPKREEWIEHLAKVVSTADENCYFVGHSLGCITILRYLESLPESAKVGGVILVAGFAMNLPNSDFSEIHPFTNDPLDWEKLKLVCPKYVAIHSDNDPYVPIENGEIFRDKLGADLIIEPGMMHFSGDDGVTKLPIALEAILNIAK